MTGTTLQPVRGFLLGALAALAFTAAPAAAQKPIQLALVAPDLQLVDQEEAVRGLRLSLYGNNVRMTGFDLGLVAQTTEMFKGFQYGLVTLNEGNAKGVSIAAVNVTQGFMQGLQIALVNSGARAEGLQLGGFNHSRNYEGLQLGLVNYAAQMEGVQLGLINIIKEGGVFPVLPLVNWSLNRQ
ncbi:MAG: hypothetical protein RQ745_11345 [Longimicrobiales bacterium]|nr:hypothetical protein [Longimicrobiales bacterium]